MGSVGAAPPSGPNHQRAMRQSEDWRITLGAHSSPRAPACKRSSPNATANSTGAALYDINTDFTGTGFDPIAAGWTLVPVPEPGTALTRLASPTPPSRD